MILTQIQSRTRFAVAHLPLPPTLYPRPASYLHLSLFAIPSYHPSQLIHDDHTDHPVNILLSLSLSLCVCVCVSILPSSLPLEPLCIGWHMQAKGTSLRLLNKYYPLLSPNFNDHCANNCLDAFPQLEKGEKLMTISSGTRCLPHVL